MVFTLVLYNCTRFSFHGAIILFSIHFFKNKEIHLGALFRYEQHNTMVFIVPFVLRNCGLERFICDNDVIQCGLPCILQCVWELTAGFTIMFLFVCRKQLVAKIIPMGAAVNVLVFGV